MSEQHFARISVETHGGIFDANFGRFSKRIHHEFFFKEPMKDFLNIIFCYGIIGEISTKVFVIIFVNAYMEEFSRKSLDDILR